VYVDSLYYTTVRREGDSYILADKTVPVVGDYLTDGNVEAVKSTKPGAWWVIQGERASNRYFSILLDSARVDTIFVQAIGDTTYRGGAAGQAVFSPDGSMYARYNPLDDLSLFDFDRSTGLLSNFRKMHVADSGIVGGLAFSPNGRFLYACGQYDMYQFDTWAQDIEASKVHLGHYDGYFDPFPTTFYNMQLGPDCRIYIHTPSGNRVWHLIHEPDNKGPDCRFEQHGFPFPVSSGITMPNFPNYRLDIAPVCDPGIVTRARHWQPLSRSIEVFPNPSTGELWLRIPDLPAHIGDLHVRLINAAGQVCHTEQVYATSGQDIPLYPGDLPGGIYVLQVTGARGFSAVTKVVMGE
jgi:hypothetical protein